MGATCSGSSQCCSEKISYLDLVIIDEIPPEPVSELYRTCEAELKQTEKIYQGIEEYTGCQELARAAMTKGDDETRLAAFEGLLPAVDHIHDFSEYSKDMSRCFKELLIELSAKVPEGKRFAQLCRKPGLTNQLTKFLNFALKFDQQRILKPNVSNDFSYYKRLFTRFPTHPSIKYDVKKNEELQEFIRSNTPMTLALIHAAEEVSKDYPTCVYVLSTIANAYWMKLEKREPYSEHESRTCHGTCCCYF